MINILKANETVLNSWFDNWLLMHVPSIVDQPKWFKNDHNLKGGNIVLFLKQDLALSKNYQSGMVVLYEKSSYVICKGKIKYRNHMEKVNREWCRSVGQLIMIHLADKLVIAQEINRTRTLCYGRPSHLQYHGSK